MRQALRRLAGALLLVSGLATTAGAQDLFEIQVYPYETIAPRRTMFEFHTNYIPSGTHDTTDGLFANDGQFHATLEITHGWTRYFETGFYIETAGVPDEGAQFAGIHVRPRVSFPEWKSFPFKVSLSVEYAFNQAGFDPNSQTLEIRPIFEHQEGRFYLSINTVLSVALRGPDAGSAPGFEPSAKIGWDVTPRVSAGIEYYSEWGTLTDIESPSDQHHILLPAVDLNVSPDWEFNFGVGRGLTDSSEQWIVKAIIGRRFKF